MVLPPNPNMPPQPPVGPPMGAPPPMDPAMMAMGGPPPGMPPMDMGMMGMPPMGIPGFPPGVMPDPNYPGSMAVQDAELMLAMQDPEVAQALIRLLLEEMDPDPGPKYAVWYDKSDYPKPKDQNILSKADEDRQAYQLLINRMRRDRNRIRMAVVGAFKDHDSETETTFRDASLALDIHLITSILAAADIIFHKTAKKAGQREDAQKVENLCYALMEQTMRRHHAMNGTDFKVDLIKNAMSTGHLVSRILPMYDADEGDVPIAIDLLDPATCFPTRDGYGIETMTRIYQQQVYEVCRGFRLDKRKQKKVLSKQHPDGKGGFRDKTMQDTAEVIEFWNRRWYALAIDGEVIIGPAEHYLGRVPFEYTRSSIGDAGNIFEQNLKASYGVAENAMQHDLANKGQSHIQFLQYTHEQREALMGVFATEAKKIRNPPRTFEQAVTVYGDSPAVSNQEGAISMLRMGEEVEVPTPPDARFQLMGPLLASVNEAAQMGRMSPADYGLAPGSQSSGNVVEGLSESSKDKLNLWKIMIQNHVSATMNTSLQFLRDHGRKLGPEGSRGVTLAIELQHPTEDEDGYFDFDYRMLRDDNCRVKVQMTSLRMQNLGALGNAIQMWDNMGRMTDEEALELRGVRDPHAYMRKVEIEQFRKTPEFKKARLIEWMKEEEMYDELPTVLYLMATQGGQGGGAPGGPGPMPGNGGGPPTVGMPGGPGVEGGRPPQLPGPTPALSGQEGGAPVY